VLNNINKKKNISTKSPFMNKEEDATFKLVCGWGVGDPPQERKVTSTIAADSFGR
jgi:hypothetical protein